LAPAADGSFVYYGKYRFTLMAPGLETLHVEENITPPWYEWWPLDFFFETLWPFELEAGTSVVERARSGDRAAYGELVRRFRPAVYAVVLAWLHDPAEARAHGGARHDHKRAQVQGAQAPRLELLPAVLGHGHDRHLGCRHDLPACLLYPSDAADVLLRVDLGGLRFTQQIIY